MWLKNLDCECNTPTLNGMAAVDPVSAGISFLTAAAGKGGGGGGGGGTQVSTQVSPQISPSFVQQDNPTNSPVTTGATQMIANPLPNTPATGFIPGFDNGASGYTGAGYLYPGAVQSTGPAWTTYALIAAGIIGAALLYKNRAKLRRAA